MDERFFKRQTRFPALKMSLAARFDEGERIFADTCLNLPPLMKHMNDRGDKIVKRHLLSTILPAAALYRAFRKEGIDEKTALHFIESEICKAAEGKGGLMAALGKLPFAYALMRTIVKPITRLSYSTAGWSCSWGRMDGERLEVFMDSCLYCEEFSALGHPELGQAFCRIDHIVYLPLAPNICFTQQGTIARGAKRCDFVFLNGRLK